MKALQCPFLSRLSLSTITKHAPALINMADECPVMTHAKQYTRMASVSTSGKNLAGIAKKCPFSGSKLSSSTSAAITALTQDETLNTQPKVKSAVATSTHDDKNRATKAQDGRQGERQLDTSAGSKFGYEQFWSDRIDAKKRDHSYRVFREIARDANKFPHAEVVDSKTRVKKEIQVWCSNDYMGMSWHPSVKKSVRDAVDRYGVGAGGTRNISGSSPLHTDLESELAELHQKEAALLFTSCYVANDTSLYTLARMLPGCHIYSDAGNHASMIQGIRNSGVPKHVFRHNDPEHLRQLLSLRPKSAPKIVAFETVYSMSGDICPLADLLDVCEEFGAISFVDEVHAVGLYGKHGGGIGEHQGLLHRMDMISGTLGKAFGNIGGYIASSSKLIDTLRSFCSGFIFTTSLPPTVLTGALQAVKVLRSEEGYYLRVRHQRNVKLLREMLYQAGLPVIKCPSHILPIKVGDPQLVFELSKQLMDQYGIYVQPINYPTVAKGQEMLRVAPTPHHTEEMMENFVRSLVELWNRHNLPLRQPYCETCLMTLKKKYWFSEDDHVCDGSSCQTYTVSACAA